MALFAMALSEILMFALLIAGSMPFGYLFVSLGWPSIRKTEATYAFGASLAFGLAFSIITIISTILAEFLLKSENLFIPVLLIFFAISTAVFFTKGKFFKKTAVEKNESIYLPEKQKIFIKHGMDEAKKEELKKLVEPQNETEGFHALHETGNFKIKPVEKSFAKTAASLQKPAEKAAPQNAEKLLQQAMAGQKTVSAGQKKGLFSGLFKKSENVSAAGSKNSGAKTSEPAVKKSDESNGIAFKPFLEEKIVSGKSAKSAEKQSRLSISDFEKKIQAAEKEAAERDESTAKPEKFPESKPPEIVETVKPVEKIELKKKISIPWPLGKKIEEKKTPIIIGLNSKKAFEKPVEKNQPAENPVISTVAEKTVEKKPQNTILPEKALTADSAKTVPELKTKSDEIREIEEILKKKSGMRSEKIVEQPEIAVQEKPGGLEAGQQIQAEKKEAILKLLHELKEKPLDSEKTAEIKPKAEIGKTVQKISKPSLPPERFIKTIPLPQQQKTEDMPRRLQRFYRENGNARVQFSGNERQIEGRQIQREWKKPAFEENNELSDSLIQSANEPDSVGRKASEKEFEKMADSIFEQLDLKQQPTESGKLQAEQRQPQEHGRRRVLEEEPERTESEKNPFIESEEKPPASELGESLDLEKDSEKNDIADFEKGLDFENAAEGKEICPNCGKESEKVLFCPNCGTAFCKNCSKQSTPTSLACPSCKKNVNI